MRGSIPAELVKEAKGGEVHVDMEDHRLEQKFQSCYVAPSEPHICILREEEFVREKVKAKPFQVCIFFSYHGEAVNECFIFQGSGNVLGSIAPSVAPPAADASLDPKQVGDNGMCWPRDKGLQSI